MLLFLTPERKDELPVLEYSAGPAIASARFDYDEFLAEPCSQASKMTPPFCW